ncbi:MAG: hypothetical protein ACI9AQ_002466, partial [Dinoroseobacter sp.]
MRFRKTGGTAPDDTKKHQGDTQPMTTMTKLMGAA